jgi:hypothetical protein
MDVLVVNRLRAGACLRRCYGFSTPVRSGICSRKAIRTTKLCTGAFRLGVATRLNARPDHTCGSIASHWLCAGHFRFTPNSGHPAASHYTTLCAMCRQSSPSTLLASKRSKNRYH